MKAKMLFISTYVPYPPIGGAYQRTYNLLLRASRDYDIYFVGFEKNKEDCKNIDKLKEFCKEAISFRLPEDWSRFSMLKQLIFNIFSIKPFTVCKYYKKDVVKAVQRLVNDKKISILHIDMIDLADYRHDVEAVKTILTHHNVESILYFRISEHASNLFTKAFWYIQYLKMLHFERKMCSRFTGNACVSEIDREAFSAIAPGASFRVVPNGVDTDYFHPNMEESSKKDIIFVGSLDWPANLDAINYFRSSIWPELKKLNLSIRLKVIGKGRDNRFPHDIGSSGIEYLGFVDDIRPHVWSSLAFIVPLRIGGGTRLKILDAMALGIPVISTSIGCEGIDVSDGHNIVIADTARDFALGIKRLSEDSKLRNILSQKGRELVTSKYSWQIIYNELKGLYDHGNPTF